MNLGSSWLAPHVPIGTSGDNSLTIGLEKRNCGKRPIGLMDLAVFLKQIAKKIPVSVGYYLILMNFLGKVTESSGLFGAG